MILRMREGVTISPLDATLGGTFHIARLPEDRFIKISDALLQLLRLLDGKRDLPAVAQAYAAQTQRSVAEEDVRHICETVLIPNGLAEAADGSTPNTIDEREGRHRYIRWSVQLIGAKWVQRIAPRLAWLYDARLALVLLAANAAALVWFVTQQPMLGLHLRDLDGVTFLGVYALLHCGLLLHELGHAAAAARFGLTPGPIGFGFYLYFPVFYSDVTAAWLLPRKQRVVVNLGGLYFQSLFASLLIALWIVSPAPVLRLTVLFNCFMMISTLNPMLRWDGYWVFADLAGLPNLRGNTNALIQYAIKRLLGRPARMPAFYPLLPRLSRFFIHVYFVLSALLLGAFYVMLFVILPAVAMSVPADAARLARTLAQWGTLDIAGRVVQQGTALVVKIALVVYLTRLMIDTVRRAFAKRNAEASSRA